MQVNDDFSEIDESLFLKDDWHVLLAWAAPFAHKEAIHILECQARLCAVERVARDLRNRGQHRLVIGRSTVCLLAVSKGRFADARLLHIMRRVYAEALAARLRLRFRWLPSETQPR